MFSVYKPVILISSITITVLIACHPKNENVEAKELALQRMADTTAFATVQETNKEAYYGVVDSTAPAGGNEQSPKQSLKQTPPQNIDWDKKIIKEATLVVEAKSQKVFNDFVHDQVKRSGGYVSQEEQNKSDYKIENIATIKVPVDQFDNLVKSLTSTKDENIVTQKVTSQDVTGEVIDARARTEAKRQIRLRYLELLKQAKNMEDILKVQTEINNIQEEIEAGAGRVGYLTHAAAYSTVQLTFYEILNPSAADNKAPAFGTRVLNALGNGMDWLGELLVVLLTLWPLWLLIAGLIWGFRRWRKTRPTPKTVQ